MSLLEITKITKSFGGLRALNDVNLLLETGEIVGLRGGKILFKLRTIEPPSSSSNM